MKQKISLLVITLLILIAGCDYFKPKEANVQTEGRKETTIIQTIEPINPTGKAVRRQVDKVLDTYDQRQKDIDKVIDATQ